MSPFTAEIKSLGTEIPRHAAGTLGARLCGGPGLFAGERVGGLLVLGRRLAPFDRDHLRVG
jgi:hypothetical protein